MSNPASPSEVRITKVPAFTVPPEFPTGGATVYVAPSDVGDTQEDDDD